MTIQSSVRSGNEGTIRVKVDFAQVPAPDSYYVADYTRISVNGATVQLVFGKLESSGNRLRNKLEVNVPAYAFMGQWLSALEFTNQIKKGLVEKNFPPYVIPLGIDEETEKVQTVHSNNAFITGSDGECCIDLYFLSPRDIRFYLERSDPPRLEPLVRVIMETRLLVGLAESFLGIAEQIRGFVPPQTMDDFETPSKGA